MAQALETLLSGWETSCSRAFREEQRCWRSEDLDWRAFRRKVDDAKVAQRELFRQWRAYNVEQQVLDNCRALWDRHVQKNRRDVEEAAEMLKCLAQLGALTAGFAVSAFYDFQYTASSDNPVLPFFGVATALTVGFELNSCVLCTLLLSSVVKIGKSYITDEEEAEYMWRLRDWTASCAAEAAAEAREAAAAGPGSRSGSRELGTGPSAAAVPATAAHTAAFATPPPPPPPPAPRRDFQRHWDSRCEGLWRTALALFLSGIPTFFAVMGLAGYLKFFTSPSTVIITAVLMAAAFVYTVGLSADWAKALLGGSRSAGSTSPLDWQAGGWWRSPDPPPVTSTTSTTSGPSPFAFHRPPDKDSMWPPTSVRHPYSRTLEELPYPAILGLQPWPGTGPALRSRMERGPGGGDAAGMRPVGAAEAEADGLGPGRVGGLGAGAGEERHGPGPGAAPGTGLGAARGEPRPGASPGLGGGGGDGGDEGGGVGGGSRGPTSAREPRPGPPEAPTWGSESSSGVAR
ncbi:hypothetical protein PLESTM_001879200 [Pleodorina starrii]|nr:hypothetical protein PLESTM_001879200 [Pleodorina starrii]